ncbi:MAG: TolC family outer membrane protein [Pseudomonadota bacterium]
MLRQSLCVVILTLAATNLYGQTETLYDIYAQALESDPRVKISQHMLDIGKAQQDTAFGALLPQANAFAQLSDNEVEFDSDELSDQNRSYDGERYSLQVRQMLFDWRLLSSRAKSKRLVAQREAELLDVMGTLLVDVSERYFDVLLADGDVRLVRDEQKLVQTQLKAAEALYERNLLPITEYLETQARMDKVRTDLIEAENQAALAREELTVLTGKAVGALAPIREDFVLPPQENTIEYWTELSIQNNALLDSRREAVKVALETVEEQKGGHYPTVDLILSLQRSDVGFDNQIAPQRDTEYIGLDFNVPLFSGGSTSARVREAWSQYYIAKEEEESARREIMKLTRGAWLNAQASRRRIDATLLTVESANKSYEAMSKSFSFGTVKAADVLAALHLKTAAERDYQEAIYSYLVNWLTLQRESGSLDAQVLQQLNDALMAEQSVVAPVDGSDSG